jgi:hypothetical protein
MPSAATHVMLELQLIRTYNVVQWANSVLSLALSSHCCPVQVAHAC